MSGPEFGPRGYLPPKAAKRARKIVLREQMGWGWPLAAAAAAVLVAIAGIVYVTTSLRPPAEPFVAVGGVSEVPPDAAEVLDADQGEVSALVVRAGGPLRAFAPESTDISWCPQSRRLETADAAWLPDGRRVYGDVLSLRRLRSVVHNGVIYVDFTSRLARPAPAAEGEPPVCAPFSD